MRARVANPELDRTYKREYRARKKLEGAYGLCSICQQPLGRNDHAKRGYNKTGICKDCLHGENHYHWQGKGFKNHDGYIVVRIGRRQTMLEHRYVMQQHLGRALYDNETVHHKNGIRDDNRIENLELWVGAPRRGIRTDDAVKWAKDILWRYEGKEV